MGAGVLEWHELLRRGMMQPVYRYVVLEVDVNEEWKDGEEALNCSYSLIRAVDLLSILAQCCTEIDMRITNGVTSS